MRLRLTFLFLVVIPMIAHAQSEYVPSDNGVYNFLERMETLQIIPDYNSFDIPKTRREISDYIRTVINSEPLLDKADKEFLNDLKTEFEYELYGTFNESEKLVDGEGYDFLSQKQKYFYYYNDPEKINLFINLTGEGNLLLKNDIRNDHNRSAFLGIIGGEIRGTILNKFGLFIKGTDGNVFGSREAAYLKPDLQYNYKLNENPGETFFDETQGYITADFGLVRFKYGRDRMNIGYGTDKIILGNSAPLFDYLGMNIKYKFFSYSFFHGQLLGREYYDQDSVTGGVHVVDSKYMAYHRIAFDISKHLNIGAGEVVVYGERPVDLSYLNPFSFYKSVEHSNRDRDNAMLFFDINNKSIEGIKFYGSFLIDDITFGKLGTGWWGNQTIIDAGVNSQIFYKYLPLGINLQYTKIDPYVYTHRLIRNNYTSFGYSLSSFNEPNSELFLTEINYRFSGRFRLSLLYNYKIHGANPLNADGSVGQNVGGDINLGHRTFDSEHVKFLDGHKEYSRYYTLTMIYEPVNEYFITLSLNYINETLQTTANEMANFLLLFSLKI
jgi:hypothetical protein